MINSSFLRRARTGVLTICVLLVSACGGISPPHAAVPGSRPLEASEYVNRFAGKSILYDTTPNGQKQMRETYFAKDGTFQVVDLYRDVILEGTWAVNSPLGVGANMILNFRVSGISAGKAFRSSPSFGTMYVYVLPDGTASVFSRTAEGPMITKQPKPTPGFQSRARFNSIKRKIPAALGS